MSKLTQKIKKDPNNPERYFQRGLEFSKIGKIREAEEDYNMALQLNPNYIDARLNRGIIFYNSNRFQ
jgi:lipoprotein NlpI